MSVRICSWDLSNDVRSRGKIVQEGNRCQQRKRLQKRRNTNVSENNSLEVLQGLSKVSLERFFICALLFVASDRARNGRELR